MATKSSADPPDDAPVDELTELNRRASDAGAEATTAEARDKAAAARRRPDPAAS